tara:strand:+ start:163 stop:1086 length:924 start_codon:yes stop_codon:yes gene_type:complete
MALPTVTQPNFNGIDAGFYISNAFKQANSLEYMTLMENIKYKMNIQQMASTGAIADASCDFTTAGTLALTERVLEPKNLQVNLELCKGNLLDSWTALTLRAGAGGTSPTFDEYLISYIASTIAQGTEESIWNGSGAAASGQFLGLTTPVNGTLLAAQDGDVVQVVNSGGAGVDYTAATILDNLDLVAAAIPTAVYGKEDLFIYMSQGSFRNYISAVSAITNYAFGNMNDNYVPMYQGIKLAVCNGMSDNNLVAAQKSNLYFGTDLISDSTSLTLLDMAFTGSDNMRLVARYSGGVTQGMGADCVLAS